MADNVELNAGSGGSTLAAASLSISDDTAIVQMVGCGILSGSEGSWSYADMVGGAGAVAAGVQRVTLASDDPAVTDLAAIEVLLTAANVDHAANEALLTTIDADTSAMVVDLAAIEVLLTAANVDHAANEVLLTSIDGKDFATQTTLAAILVDTGQIETLLGTIDADTSKIPSQGTAAMAASTPVTIASDDTLTAAANALLTSIDGNITACNTGAVVVSNGTITAITNDVNIADGGNSITVDNAGLTELAAAINTNRVDVNIANDAVGIGGGTQYTEGDSDATITGMAMMMEGAADALVAAPGTAADGLLVNLGTNNDITLATLPDTAAGDLAALVVDLAAIEVDIAAIEVTQNSIALDATAIKTAVEIVDDWDESDRAKVNVIAGQAGIAGGSGVDGATVPRVTLATDVGLPAGTNAIGKLAANSGVDIGDVDVTSISAGTNTIGGTISQPSSSTMYDGTTAATVKRASGLAASGTTAMVAAVAGKKIRVLALQLIATSATATNIYIANNDNDLIGDSSNPIPLATDADGDNIAGLVMPWNPGGWFETDTANEALNLILSAAQDVIYAVTYIEVD